MNLLLFLKAVLIGIVEGLTEFLPVSSTAHILLAEEAIGFRATGDRAFEVVIQLGAILAICWLYREKLFCVLRGFPQARQARLFTRNILVAFLPAAAAGALLHDYVTTHLFGLRTVALALLLGGIAIVLIERMTKRERFTQVEEFPWLVALAVGCMQSFALIPGVSRSGATIMGALLLGADRKSAAEFSFFLAIPTMLGATALSLYSGWELLGEASITLIVIGFVSAFFSALVVVRWMISFVQTHGFAPFGWYRIALGAALLAFAA